MFKFVSDSVGGLGSKRKLTQRSCDTCRKRHKRCHHAERDHREASATSPLAVSPAEVPTTLDTSTTEFEPRVASGSIHHLESPVSQGQNDITSAVRDSAPTEHLASPAAPSKLSENAYLRFIGDLSPEASFVSHQRQSNGTQSPSRHDAVGVWLGQRGQRPEPSTGSPGVSNGTPDESTIERLGLAGLRTLSPFLRKECLSVLPPDYEFGLMLDLYYEKINPIFPVLEGEDLRGYNSVQAAALKQGICLIAALDPRMKPHLQLPHSEHVLNPSDFRACVAAAVKQSLDMGFITDKLVLLQVNALMAFYVDSPSCSELSTYYCSQVIHYSQTLGLHIGWPHEDAKGTKARRLFWCVWILDRLNAALNGRPVLYHSRDMDPRILQSAETQDPAFRLLIRITVFLDDVISQYRPHPMQDEHSREEREPSFEQLVLETRSAEVSSPLLASLEMFYYVVVILRHRPRERKDQALASSDLQWLGASGIVGIASEEFRSAIVFWPVLPYAVSMSASVSYKSLRNGLVPYRRKRAYALFHSSCEILDDLGKAFLSARTMAELATETMQEVERVAADKGKTSRTDKRLNGDAHPKHGAGKSTTLPYGPGAHSTGSVGETNHLQQQDTTMSVHKDSSFTSIAEPASILTDVNFIGDVSIFNDFDPNFDLGRIDAMFSSNLDPSYPKMSLETDPWWNPSLVTDE